MSSYASSQILVTRIDDRSPQTEPQALLEVQGLRIELASGDDVVSDISFSVAPGEILGLVGESGSGKTTIATALLGYVRAGARITSGSVRLGGQDILTLSDKELRKIRGRHASHVAQDPAMSLNPLLRVGRHVDEVLAVHEGGLSKEQRKQRILEVFREVGLPADEEFLQRFPHQLSGGQQQRVQLALAFVLRPRLIVLDEPTTALDVSTQAMVLATIRNLCRQYGVAAVYVSHDLGVVRALVDKVIVLYAGRIAESGPLKVLFDAPRHPYSQGLLSAITDVTERRPLQPIPGQAPAPGTRPRGCAFAPRCPFSDEKCGQEPALESVGSDHLISCHHYQKGQAFSTRALESRPPVASNGERLLEVEGLNSFYGHRQVLFDISLRLAPGECLALVGESGSGKTTIARALAGLGENANGTLKYQGQALSLRARERAPEIRHQIQYIFQNPYRALNPRHTVGQTLIAVLQHFFALDAKAARARAISVLQRVSLQAELLDVYPRELSGGERQRVAIARALVCEPRVLICDEITSALDVSVQANILSLLRKLQDDGLSLLFVTHDLGVVRAIADQVVVLSNGRVVERGPVDAVLDHPVADYTSSLVNNSPSLIGRQRQPRLLRPLRHFV